MSNHFSESSNVTIEVVKWGMIISKINVQVRVNEKKRIPGGYSDFTETSTERLVRFDLVRNQYWGPPRVYRSRAARLLNRRALLRRAGMVGAVDAFAGVFAVVASDLLVRPWLSLKMLQSESTETKIFPPFRLPLLALNQYWDAPTFGLGATIFELACCQSQITSQSNGSFWAVKSSLPSPN